MKKRTITIGIILISIILLLYFYFENRNKLKVMNKNTTSDCDKYSCGGFTQGIAPQCPQGCRCGAGDPMIPDAPRKCIAE
jgi:hypothetical protein